jgi:hypothetical protein
MNAEQPTADTHIDATTEPEKVLEQVVESDQNVHLPNPEIPGATDRAIILGQDGRWVAGWALRFIILVAAGYLLFRGLGLIWTGLLPVLLALLVATVLWPPTNWLRQRGLPAALSAAIVIIGFFAIIGGVFAAMAPTVTTQSKDLVNQASEGIGSLQEWIQGPPLNLDLGQFENVLNDVTSFLQERLSSIASSVFSGISTASSIVVTLILMLVLTFFFLKDGTGFLPLVRRATGPNVGWHLTELLTRIWNTLAGFVRTQAIISLVDAVFIGIGLVFLQVPLAFVLAVVTFFGGFIPIVGALFAGSLAVIIALVSNGLTNAIMVVAVILVVQQVEGNILQPMLQSRAMNLHAAIVLLSVTLGSAMFGVIGAFLAVPIAATVAVLIRYHFELVALRAGEITINDMEMATNLESATSVRPQQAFNAFMQRLNSWRPTGKTTSDTKEAEENSQ